MLSIEPSLVPSASPSDKPSIKLSHATSEKPSVAPKEDDSEIASFNYDFYASFRPSDFLMKKCANIAVNNVLHATTPSLYFPSISKKDCRKIICAILKNMKKIGEKVQKHKRLLKAPHAFINVAKGMHFHDFLTNMCEYATDVCFNMCG